MIEISLEQYERLMKLNGNPQFQLPPQPPANDQDTSQNEQVTSPNDQSTIQADYSTELKKKIIQSSTEITSGSGSLRIYLLPKVEICSNSGIRMIHVGPKVSSFKNNFRILVIGQTGAGKSTFINGIANFLFGVKWEDNFRFKIIAGDDIGDRKEAVNNQGHSQTDFVSAYTFNYQPGFKVPFDVTIVDTPGFGDTRGIEQDKKTVERFHSLFQNQIDEINVIAFVMKSSENRFDGLQKYIISETFKVFGDDVEENIIFVFTHGGRTEPEMIETLKTNKISVNFNVQLDNSIFFCPNDTRKSHSDKALWDDTQELYQELFNYIGRLKPKSLKLTKKIIQKRKNLTETLGSLIDSIKQTQSEMENIKEDIKSIKLHEDEINTNQGWKNRNRVTRTGYQKVDLRSGEFVTNCTSCSNQTCHYPCYIDNDSEKNECAVMDKNGYCKICGHYWTVHHNFPYRWEESTYDEYEDDKAMEQRYQTALGDKSKAESMLSDARQKFIDLWKVVMIKIEKCAQLAKKLQQKSLQKSDITIIDYIDQIIEHEKTQHNSAKRVENLLMIKKQEELILHLNKDEKEKIIQTQIEAHLDAEMKKYLPQDILSKIK